MRVVQRVRAPDKPQNDCGHGGGADDAASPTASPRAVSPDLVNRFLALIEEVTDELMQCQGGDRRACRADAISLLIATARQFDDSLETGESPLTFLLLEERHKAMAALNESSGEAPLPRYVRA